MKNKKNIRIFIGITGVFFIVAGVIQGGYKDTLMKAIMICLECIGIG